MIIKEQFILSKYGDLERSEDGVYVGEEIVAVIDGATSKSNIQIKGLTSGQFATMAIIESLNEIDPQKDAYETLSYLSNALREKAQKFCFNETPSASIVYYNQKRQEIVSFGDCQFMINGKSFIEEKEMDKIVAEKRAEILRKAIKDGVSLESLLERDIGREGILADLKEAAKKANFNGAQGYGVLNGKPIIKKYIITKPVPKKSEIILASDGYPEIRSTLNETEKVLLEIIKDDPLCFNSNKRTKGVLKGQVSYDDRSFIKILTE